MSEDNKWKQPDQPPPPLFTGKKEKDLVKQINDEVIERVVGQTIIYYPISLEHTNFHDLYGEAIDKTFLDPIRVYAMVKWDSQNTTTTPLGVDRIEKICIFQKKTDGRSRSFCQRRISYSMERIFMILTLVEPVWLYGHVESSFEITADCVRARKGLFEVREQ